jgi:GT2 family glycosyltransferase
MVQQDSSFNPRNDATVCVVIVNYNSGALLTECVQSVLASRVHAAVYVSDNASEDDSIARLRARVGDHPLVTVVRNERNLGFAAGNNIVLPLCRAEYILCLNPDAVLAENALENLLAAAAERREFACFAARMVQSERRNVLDGAGDAYHVSGLVWRRGYGAPASASAHAQTKEVFSACAAAALYRRDAMEAVGGFDEDYFCYLEDVDLGFRLRLLGYRSLYVPDALVYHVGSATAGKESDFVVYHGHRNLVWTYVKNMPAALFWLYLPLHIAANVAMVVRYGLQGRWAVMLRAKRDALKTLPVMWQKRRGIQARRIARARELRQLMEKGIPRRHR